MNIYIISLISRENYCYDEFCGFVIVANNEKEVLDMAVIWDSSCHTEEEAWNEATIENVGDYTGSKKESFILLSSFKAASAMDIE